MDSYVEYLVKKKNGPTTIILQILIVMATAFGVAAVMFFLGGVGAIVATAALYGGYYAVTAQNLEYEYLFTNGEIDVDKIVAKRKRARLLNFECRDIEKMEELNERNEKKVPGVQRIIACSVGDKAPIYVIDVRHKKLGKVQVIINLSDEMKEAMKPMVSRTVGL